MAKKDCCTVCKQLYHSLDIKQTAFFLYFVLILLSQVVLHMTSKLSLVSSFYLTVGFSLIVCPIVFRRVNKLEIGRGKQSNPSIKGSLVFFLIAFSVLLLHYLAFYPGAFSLDSISQYSQAISGSYNDWHPFVHTFLVFTLPLKLTGGWVGSIVLFQIIFFSLALMYSLCTIQSYTNQKFAFIAMLFILLNPQTGSIVMYPWKDVAFAIGALLLTSFSVRVYMTSGRWMESIPNTLAYIATLILTTLFRHNAVLFTVPLLIGTILFIHKKRAVQIILASLMLFAAVKGPVYSCAKVEAPGKRQIETLGLPMTVIGAVAQYHPERMDAETREFVYAVAPQEVWEECYSIGSYNSIKWDSRTNNEVIEQYGRFRVLKILLRCFKVSPITAMKGLITLTDSVYTITDLHDGYSSPGIMENQYRITCTGNRVLQRIIQFYSYTRVLFPHLFDCFGMLHLVLILFILARWQLSSLDAWKKLLLVLPLFCYNYGTTLLLTSYGDSGRFFYYSYLLFPMLLVFFFGEAQPKLVNKSSEWNQIEEERQNEKSVDYRSWSCRTDRGL